MTCLRRYSLVLLFSLLLVSFVFYKQYGLHIAHRVPPALWSLSDFAIAEKYFNHSTEDTALYNLKTAQAFYERAIVADPLQSPLLWYQSGRVDFLNGDFDTALIKFRKQEEYFGDQVPNLYYMTALTHAYKARQTNDPHEWMMAEEDFKKTISYFYEAPWPYVDLAWVHFSQGEYDAMLPVIEKGFSHEANNPWLLNMYGLALWNTEKKELARQYFLFAAEKARALTVEEWSKSYPGNSPEVWERGLTEFRDLIQKNAEMSSGG